MLVFTLLAVGILVLLVASRRSGSGDGETRAPRWLDGRFIVAVVFVATFVVLWYSWAAWNPIPVVHDEMSYVLQAQIFAQAKWALPSPPLPLFWEQPHVLTEPTLASKYFPGHALLMSIGALVGWLPLMPLVLQSLVAALLFVLARRVASGGVALAAWIIWLFSPMALYFGPTYFSEATTTTCWLAGWYALLRWREAWRTRWLVCVAVATGYCEVTRPLTGVAYAIPLAVVVIATVARKGLWRDLACAVGAGFATLSIIPLWSWRTTGNWRITPLASYTRAYMPYDVPGFGLDRTPPTHSITPELFQLNLVYSSAHVSHVPRELLRMLGERAQYLGVSTWGSTSEVLAVFAVIGLVTLRAETAFALVSALTLLVTYLAYGTPAQWTLYYYESVPVYAYLTAAGLAWCASLAGRPARLPLTGGFAWRSVRWSRALVATSLVLALGGLVPLTLIHRQHISDRRYLAPFDALLATIHDSKAILFVRHAPLHNPHVAFVRNTAHLDDERIWVVYDRGDSANAKLLAMAPGRSAYLFDEHQKRTYVYTPQTAH